MGHRDVVDVGNVLVFANEAGNTRCVGRRRGVGEEGTGKGFVGEACEEGAGAEVFDHGHVAGDAELASAPHTDDVAGHGGVWADVHATDGAHTTGRGFGVGFVGPGETAWGGRQRRSRLGSCR